jgi:hypothetical protein
MAGAWKASSAEAAAQAAARRTPAVVAAANRRCVQLCIAFEFRLSTDLFPLFRILFFLEFFYLGLFMA